MAEEKKNDSEAKQAKSKAPKGEAGAEKKGAGKGKKGAGAGVTFAVEAGRPKGPSKPPRLKTFYETKVVQALQQSLGLKNRMEVPRLEKIVVSSCLKEALANPKALDNAMDELAAISGQRPRVTRAKKSIAAFKLREGQALGAMVTLRRARMYEFLDRLMNVALPRVRDFKGVNPKSFDGRGNYSMGLKEQIIFPEINYDRIDKIRGMNITITTSARSNDHARALLTELGMPFRKA
jgi:large subunit ribosomal protein L5